VLCRKCRTRLDPFLNDVGSHPYCEPVLPSGPKGEQLSFDYTSLHPGEDPDAAKLKAAILEVIKFKDRRNPRSHQVNIGPSELSSPCDRRIGYRMVGVPAVNTTLDPWPAIVGTAVHDWLEKAFLEWILATGTTDWMTEAKLNLSEDVTGRSDLFNVPWQMVIDYKGTSPDKMKKIKAEGSPGNYRTQLQIYGLGYENKGFKVSKLALAYFPRAGNIKDMYVDVFDYDRSIAEASLARIPAIATRLLELDVMSNPHRWEQMDAVASHDCGFCPWYNFRRTPELGASDEGCPGK
jgi:hypothetical protein